MCRGSRVSSLDADGAPGEPPPPDAGAGPSAGAPNDARAVGAGDPPLEREVPFLSGDGDVGALAAPGLNENGRGDGEDDDMTARATQEERKKGCSDAAQPSESLGPGPGKMERVWFSLFPLSAVSGKYSNCSFLTPATQFEWVLLACRTLSSQATSGFRGAETHLAAAGAD